MSIRIAFAGFRHPHVDELYSFVKSHATARVAGAAEDDPTAASRLSARGIKLTHTSIDDLFAHSDDFDALAIGDFFGRRGSLAIRALEAKKHVIADKPLCTSRDELTEIDRLRRKHHLSVGCMLNNRDIGSFRKLKSLLADGTIGRVQTIAFSGQHPLLYGSRAGWYFEEGKHGGTINDIAIHAIDIIPWLTGAEWRRVVAARTWNESLQEHPHFQVCAQVMLELDTQAGVIGDVSYLSPDSQGYTVPQYWRYTIHGTGGIIEMGMKIDDLRVWKDGAGSVESIAPETERVGGVYQDFLDEISGKEAECDLTTDQVIQSSRIALEIQQAANRKQYPQELS